MGTIAKGPRVPRLEFAGVTSLELTVVHRVGALGLATVTTRRVQGVALPGLPLDGRAPPSRLEMRIGNTVIYRRPFAMPGRVEVYGHRHEWVELPLGSEQVIVTLVPDFAHADVVLAIGPSGPWFQRVLL